MKDFERIDILSEQMDFLIIAFRNEVKKLDKEMDSTENTIHKSIYGGIQNSLYRILLDLTNAPEHFKKTAREHKGSKRRKEDEGKP